MWNQLEAGDFADRGCLEGSFRKVEHKFVLMPLCTSFLELQCQGKISLVALSNQRSISLLKP